MYPVQNYAERRKLKKKKKESCILYDSIYLTLFKKNKITPMGHKSVAEESGTGGGRI